MSGSGHPVRLLCVYPDGSIVYLDDPRIKTVKLRAGSSA